MRLNVRFGDVTTPSPMRPSSDGDVHKRAIEDDRPCVNRMRLD